MFRSKRNVGLLFAGFGVMLPAAAPASDPDDPDFPNQWALRNTGQVINGASGKAGADIRALEAWEMFSGSFAVVAIVGTGVDPHSEYADRLLEGYVVPSAGGDPYSTLDTTFIGTHVAGIIAAATGNAVGVAGINDHARLLPVRVLLGNSGTAVSAAEGIEWAVDQGADVIVVPLQFYVDSQRLADAATYAASHDVVVVAPAGHAANNQVAFPAAYSGCIAVSSTTNEDAFAPFSNYGPQVDLAAPSLGIWSTRTGDAYGFETQPGSHYAAAYVAAVASLIRSYAPQLSAEEVRAILVDSADDLGVAGWDPYFGAGRLNARRALELTNPPALRFEYVDSIPMTILPNATTSFTIRIADAAQSVTPGSPAMVYRTAGAGFELPRPLQSLGGGYYAVELPAVPCNTIIEYYLTVGGNSGAVVSEPWDAPARLHSARAIHYEPFFDDDFETDLGWQVVTEGGKGTTGAWTRVIPVGTSAQPSYDRSPDYGRRCYVTGQHFGGGAGTNDVDGGPVRLISPMISLTESDAEVSYSRWFYTASGVPDELTVELSRDGGTSWLIVETVDSTKGWERHFFRLSEFPHAVGNQLRIRFTTSDLPGLGDSLTEAGVDEFHVRGIVCAAIRGDADGDGDVDLVDYERFHRCWNEPTTPLDGPQCSAFDFDPNGHIDLRDFQAFQNEFRP